MPAAPTPVTAQRLPRKKKSSSNAVVFILLGVAVVVGLGVVGVLFQFGGAMVREGIERDKADVASGKKVKRVEVQQSTTVESAKQATGLESKWEVTVDAGPPLGSAALPHTTRIPFYVNPPDPLPKADLNFPPVSAVLSHNQQYLAICTADSPRGAQVWDLTTGQIVWSCALQPKASVLAVAPGGKSLLVEDEPTAEAKVVGAPDGRVLSRFPKPQPDASGSAGTAIVVVGRSQAVDRYHFLSDNELIYFRNDDAPQAAGEYRPRIECQVFNIATSKLRKFSIDGAGFAPPAVSPGGKWIATAHSRQLNFFDIATGKRAAHLEFKTDYPREMAFSADGKEFAYFYGPHSGPGCGLRVLDVATGRELAHFKYPSKKHELLPGMGFEDRVRLRFTRDGSQIVYNGSVFFDRQDGKRTAIAGLPRLPWAQAALDAKHALVGDFEEQAFVAKEAAE